MRVEVVVAALEVTVVLMGISRGYIEGIFCKGGGVEEVMDVKEVN